MSRIDTLTDDELARIEAGAPLVAGGQGRSDAQVHDDGINAICILIFGCVLGVIIGIVLF